jgi:hypothetical protein
MRHVLAKLELLTEIEKPICGLRFIGDKDTLLDPTCMQVDMTTTTQRIAHKQK